ncbi:MAG: hypothetical protein HC841_07105 [Verrucomicrobiae bacterium]|nr:hypothetical protein [Verrucomicrobiae bacterium]
MVEAAHDGAARRAAGGRGNVARITGVIVAAEAFGGITTLRAIAAPYAGVRFIPTGGITAQNVGAYLRWDRVLACGGSWMVRPDLIAAGDFATIEQLVREAVAAARAIGDFPA